MAHHQHHGMHNDAPKVDQSVTLQPASTSMPSISEDELAAEADEPPEQKQHQHFTKTAPPPYIRRQSMLTKALHTDSESHNDSHDESLGFSSAMRQASRSSTCSTWSAKSDFTSDDGLPSHTSSPSNKDAGHMATQAFRKLDFGSEAHADPSAAIGAGSDTGRISPKQATAEGEANATADGTAAKPAVEASLGRKRCISFACGRNGTRANDNVAVVPKVESTTGQQSSETKKRPCMLKFACPSKISWKELDKEQQAAKATKQSSPPPPHRRTMSPSPAPIKSRHHRDSDTTIRNVSPKTSRKVPPIEARKAMLEEPEPEPDRSEATTFHEFASADEPVEDWVHESTCHRSRLTVQDTLKKENDIRQIGEEAEEEALEEEDEELACLTDGPDSDDEDEVSDAGFQTDDEDGFAESDDDSDDGSDYEWWAPRKSSRLATMAPGDALHPPAMRRDSDSSLDSVVSPKYREAPKGTSKTKLRRKSGAVAIRPATPELPDSTDFVCGTLDEDRPLEEAYASCLEQRKAAKHVSRPQDIDPTFPTDIDASDDDEDEVPVGHGAREDGDPQGMMHGSLEDMDDEEEESRGRKLPASIERVSRLSPTPAKTTTKCLTSPPPPTIASRKKSPAPPAAVSRRLKSPPPPITSSRRHKSPAPHAVAGAAAPKATSKPVDGPPKRGQILRSPPPRPLFGHSPRRLRSPAPQRLTSPPPSRRGSPPGFRPKSTAFGTAFLGHRPQLTHTASLPRSPNPMARKQHREFPLTPRDAALAASPFDELTPGYASASASISNYMSNDASDSVDIDEDEDDGNDTAREAATPTSATYTRGAIDIVQGLERKRLRRRMKFHEKYCRKEEKKRERGETIAGQKRPQPGKGAQRMRQVGIECALYRGKRVLSV